MDEKDIERAGHGPNWLIIGVVGALIAMAAFAGWRAHLRTQQLEERLAASEEREAKLHQQIADEAKRMAQLRSRAEKAEQVATEAQKEALEAAKLRGQAEWERELARVEAEQAQEQAQQAEQVAAQSKRQYEELRARRNQELGRMEEALSRIVDTERTALGMVMRLGEDVLQFDFDEAEVREQDKELLSRIAGVLLASHGYRLYIDGHTDDQGSAAYNKQLSRRRAQAVRQYFVKAGVPPEIMTVRGYGEEQPRVKGTSETARQKNRRVEIGVVDTVIQYEADDGEPYTR